MADSPHPAAAVLTAELRRAFRNTHYRFRTSGGELLLAIDSRSEPLRKLLREYGQTCAAAITAYNPGSHLRDADSNRRAQQQLERELQTLGLTCFPGRHEDPGAQWPAEVSTLVLGLSCPAACGIAARYRQLAIVWCDATATPRLIEVAGPAARP